MSRFKGRTITSQHGFIPGVLTMDGDDFMDTVLDNAYVEYGTGCWIDKGSDPEVAYEAQIMVYNQFLGGVPDGEVVVNSCNDYRVCYNPNCLITLDIDDIPPNSFTH
jgi:hypothetical protein